MPYKNPIDQKKYMKRYMRDYRKMEREILRRAREMGIKPSQSWKPPPLKPRKPQKRRRR